MSTIGRPHWMIGSPECDWTEDSEHENGNYFCKCVCCACDFIGHKRRHVCRRCFMSNKEACDAMTPEERTVFDKQRDEAITEFLKNNPDFEPKKL